MSEPGAGDFPPPHEPKPQKSEIPVGQKPAEPALPGDPSSDAKPNPEPAATAENLVGNGIQSQPAITETEPQKPPIEELISKVSDMADQGKVFAGANQDYTAREILKRIKQVAARKQPLSIITRAEGLREEVALALGMDPKMDNQLAPLTIGNANTFDELITVLKGLEEGVQGSRKEPYSKGELVGLVVDGFINRDPNRVTKAEGLRQAVLRVMANESTSKEKPSDPGLSNLPLVGRLFRGSK